MNPQPRSNRGEGSIGDAFASLSKNQNELPPRFSDLKREIIGAHGEAILASWNRLLQYLGEQTIPGVEELGPQSVPEVDFAAIIDNKGDLPDEKRILLEKCGTIVIRGLFSEEQVLGWKQSVRDYVKANPSTRGFPAGDIQVYELYWSKAQLEARSHENMLLVQRALNRVWKKKPEDKVVLTESASYCDRLRMRMVTQGTLSLSLSCKLTFGKPGDKSFNLGPHLDGGSLERWEDDEYRKCYAQILQGNWEQHDAFNISPRLSANIDMYNGPGGCSAFRSYQGWTSLSHCAPTNGTLRVIPDLKASTAYTILRPFVSPLPDGTWELDSSSPLFHGAAMGAGQELPAELHPHISPRTFVSVPTVRPGDAVFWHCDVAHMVESEHKGTTDASVFYIPIAPLCEINADYLRRQRENFLRSQPPPDFPGGVGESEHVGRGTVDDLSEVGKRAMGCASFAGQGETPGEKAAYALANEILGL